MGKRKIFSTNKKITMKEIKLQDNTYLFVEVPDDSERFYKKQIPFVSSGIGYYDSKGYQKYIPLTTINNWNIISTTKDITEEQAGSIVEYHATNQGQGYYDYILNNKNAFGKAKESLQSLIQANGLDVNKNFLILKKL